MTLSLPLSAVLSWCCLGSMLALLAPLVCIRRSCASRSATTPASNVVAVCLRSDGSRPESASEPGSAHSEDATQLAFSWPEVDRRRHRGRRWSDPPDGSADPEAPGSRRADPQASD